MRKLLVCTIGAIAMLVSGVDGIAQDVLEGYFDFRWNEEKGTIELDITDKLDEEFLYVNSLSSGVGSNDIGLDRNQLGGEQVVKFVRSGPKVLLLQPNLDYRAITDNELERMAVEEAFAQSVIWGFEAKEADGKVWVDITPFLLRDAHGVVQALSRNKQGTYSVDKSRSAVHMDRTKNFPENSEFDALVTFKGKPTGGYIRSVTPTPTAVTVHMHHSFVQLPDEGFEMREFDPRSGFYAMSYYDYATPIDQPLEKRYIVRHRLEKKDPSATVSEAVEPIVYYIDAGCPEPIKSALMEGASWWNQAFEAVGYRDAFQVKELPDGADPMDVRYNMINWVHRSTRGWSYGSSVTDPRTGEIIKGHVLLGSLRVRQDYMIAQGLASLFEQGDESTDPLVQMALARLRQLSAHEVGHTIGLMHNFAASTKDRASVMDYPHPYITVDDQGRPDFSDAYAVGIGDWDKRTILFGYQDFSEDTDEAKALNAICEESIEMGFKYISDADSRPVGGGHPDGHLWDNGENAVAELIRLMNVRKAALSRFGEATIQEGTYMAYLEQVLVPLYLSHRYQIEAISKLIGGVDYDYKLRGDGNPNPQPVTRDMQLQALQGLMNSINPNFLSLDSAIVALIPPHPAGVERNRELFDTKTGLFFDPLAAAEGSVNHTFTYALNSERLARLINQNMSDPDQLSLGEYLDAIVSTVTSFDAPNRQESTLKMMVEKRLAHHLMIAASNLKGQEQVAAEAMYALHNFSEALDSMNDASVNSAVKAHIFYLTTRIEEFIDDPKEFEDPAIIAMPPGSPIGCGGGF